MVKKMYQSNSEMRNLFKRFSWVYPEGAKKLFSSGIFFFLFVVSLCFFSCCLCKKKTTGNTNHHTENSSRDYEKEGYIKGTVVYYEIDACKYIIQLVSDPNGPDVIKQLEPVNLPADFQKDQLAVWIKYIPRKGAVSACMAGEIVEITDIRIRK